MSMNIKRSAISFGLLAAVSLTSISTFAVEERAPYPEIYPFVPFKISKIYNDTKNFSEDENFISNVYDVEVMGLSKAKTFVINEAGEKEDNQPWMSTYWPLNKGLIADPNPHVSPYNPLNMRKAVDWKWNYKKFLKRKSKLHKDINKKNRKGKFVYDSKDLSELAASEKYDLLLGDSSFDLTNRLWKYMQKWGSKKEYGFLSSLNKVGGNAIKLAEKMVASGQYETVLDAMPKAIELKGGLAEYYAEELVKSGKYNTITEALAEATEKAIKEQKNYVLKAKNSMMALWEGICHGWATAAGIVPRPLNSVTMSIPDGRKITFYPDDLKGLASLLWANSLIQDSKFEPIDKDTKENIKDENGNNAVMGGIIMQGLRCNQKKPKTDEWGRYYDATADLYSKKLEARCVGVHPATWHMGLVNVMGKQGRSFVVERKVKAAVDNHPLSAYSMEYFNPYTGDYTSLSEAVQQLREDDQFINFRNPKTKMIVGVNLTMTYMAWKRPERRDTDNPSFDEVKEVPMMYDLELDVDGNIIGGQWRTTETGKNFLNISANRAQPDFFWTVTKHWRRAGEQAGQTGAYFNEIQGLSEWTDLSIAPPSDWKDAAFAAHGFNYKKTHELGWNEKCKLIRKKGTGSGPIVEVPCEYNINKPQPLINVINKLIKLSR
jgi:hypothetical protein